MIGKRNIWSLVANEHQNSPMADIDWAEMEGLFCQQVPPMIPAALCSSYGASSDAERRRREPTEVSPSFTPFLDALFFAGSAYSIYFRSRFWTVREA